MSQRNASSVLQSTRADIGEVLERLEELRGSDMQRLESGLVQCIDTLYSILEGSSDYTKTTIVETSVQKARKDYLGER